MTAPKAARPHMPGYGITAAAGAAGLLPWGWAQERLTRAHNYWVATTRPSGAPHLTAVWGVWLDNAFIFSCAPTSRKALNLAANQACSVSTEHADEAVIVEGIAEDVSDRTLLQQFKDAYDPKYDWKIEIDKGGIFRARPRVAFAFVEHANQFETTATRWTFDA